MTLPVLLIPAYNPDKHLLTLLTELKQSHPELVCVVVNDGSNISCAEVFNSLDQQGIIVLHHTVNRGKGDALKTGMRYFLKHHAVNASGIITADADGQHCVEDILRITRQFNDNPHQLHMGIRSVLKQDVPLRSRLGNGLTRWLFNKLTNNHIKDTQTGLRGIPIKLIKAMISSKLSHYEFEFEMLFVAKQLNIDIVQIPIQTIYFNKNSQSHFNPWLDSLKIYYVFFRFCGVSLLSFCADFIFFCLILSQFHHIGQAVFGARIASASLNFVLNKQTTFQSNHHTLISAVKFSLLATLIAASSYYALKLISLTGINVYFGKILADTLLFFISFFVQYTIVFYKKSVHSNQSYI